MLQTNTQVVNYCLSFSEGHGGGGGGGGGVEGGLSVN